MIRSRCRSAPGCRASRRSQRLVVWNRGLVGCGLIHAGTQHTDDVGVDRCSPSASTIRHSGAPVWSSSARRSWCSSPAPGISSTGHVGGARRPVRHPRVGHAATAPSSKAPSGCLTNRGARVELLTAPCIDVTSPLLQARVFRSRSVTPGCAHLNRLVVSIARAARRHGPQARFQPVRVSPRHLREDRPRGGRPAG